jgi:hypothetical protein
MAAGYSQKAMDYKPVVRHFGDFRIKQRMVNKARFALKNE